MTVTYSLPSLLPQPKIERLANGLEVCVLRNSGSPVVTTALWYRAGTRDDDAGHGGSAHFLEHMMFKGSAAYGPGEIDRMTQALGGSNNALTSHDGTLYYFSFAPDRWQQGLAIEADRMAALTLAAEQVASERQVIEEEIAMYEGEPWDALEQQVTATFYGEHSYGRPVLGSRSELATIDGAVLGEFHRRYYRPDNAVLVIAGDVDSSAQATAARLFGEVGGSAAQRPRPVPRAELGQLVRIERRHGEVSRLLLVLPAPAVSDPDHPYLKLLLAVLAQGRSSRLHRALVDDGQLCVWASADLGDTLDPGCTVLAAEVLPGVDPQRVEAVVLAELDTLLQQPPSDEELARAKKILVADWIFGHEKVHQQALGLGFARAFLGPDHPWAYLERLLAAAGDDLLPVAERFVGQPRDGVLGWSLAEG